MKFRLGPFPVHVDPSFLLVMALLGYTSGQPFTLAVLWVPIGFLAVLVHELGHAVVARAQGARPSISLVAFGGLTSWVPVRPPSRWSMIASSLAGPVVGIVVGLALMRVDTTGWSDTTYYAMQVAVFTSLGWGVLNLLPMLPLDGGQVMRELLPGTPQVRARRAAIVSLVVIAVVAVAALYLRQTYALVLIVMIGYGNVTALRGPSTRPALGGRPDNSVGVLQLVETGHRTEALHLADTAAGDVDRTVVGLLTVLEGNVRTGREMMQRGLGENASPAAVTAVMLLALHEGDLAKAEGLLVQDGAAGLPLAGRIAVRVAAAHADRGEPAEARRWLARAHELGWTDDGSLAGDPRLAALRGL